MLSQSLGSSKCRKTGSNKICPDYVIPGGISPTTEMQAHLGQAAAKLKYNIEGSEEFFLQLNCWMYFRCLETIQSHVYSMPCFKECLVVTSVFHLRLKEGRWCGHGQGISLGPEFPQFSTLLCTDFVYGLEQVS